MEISVGTYSSVRYLVEVRYWECPLIESPLYLLQLKIGCQGVDFVMEGHI